MIVGKRGFWTGLISVCLILLCAACEKTDGKKTQPAGGLAGGAVGGIAGEVLGEPPVDALEELREKVLGERLEEAENPGQDASAESPSLDWPEITEEGVDEALFWEHLDIEMLEAVAFELQTLVDEEAEAERENPELVITEGFVRVFDSERYKKVLGLGEAAMKPLYWIIYKSSEAGLYEYICARALAELSGYPFENDDGTQTWTNSKEFLERFDEMVLERRSSDKNGHCAANFLTP